MRTERAQQELDAIRRDPIRFVERAFGEDVIGRQRDILQALVDPTVEEIHVPSCHASGKTHTCARAVVTFLAQWPNDSIVLTTAPTWSQVEDEIWREIRDGESRARVALGGHLTNTVWEFAPKWYAKGIATAPGTAVNVHGYHAAHVLIVVDEADGVAAEIWQAVDALTTSAHVVVLAIGNPVNPQSAWKKRVDAARGDPSARIIRIAADDVLPLTDTGKYPFLLQRRWVEKVKRKYGETSAYYISRVLAQWPSQAADTLLPLTWLIRAKGLAVPRGPVGMGIDVGRGVGQDMTVRTIVEGGWVAKQWANATDNLMQTAGRAHVEIKQYGPVTVVVDGTGIGAGTVDKLRELGRAVIAENFGASAQDGERFANRGSEMYWWLREAFEQNLIGFSMDDPEQVEELVADLSQPKWETNARGLIVVDKHGLERGKTTRSLTEEERAHRSPDYGDSLALAFSGIRHLLPTTKLRQPTEREQLRAEFIQQAEQGSAAEVGGWVD